MLENFRQNGRRRLKMACTACAAVCMSLLLASKTSSTQVVLTPEEWPRALPGASGDGTSWIAGVHREPKWSQAPLGGGPLGKRDQGHFFQRDDNPWVDKREIFDAEGASDPHVIYEYPWDPAEDPQKFHIGDSQGHRIDCENGVLTEECYKHRWHPGEPKANVEPIKEYKRPTPHEVEVPKGEGKGIADAGLPPEETGETPPPPPPPGKMPSGERQSSTAPRPQEEIGKTPIERTDSKGVEKERGKSDFEQPVGAPEAIQGAPPEPRKDIPPEGKHGQGNKARPRNGPESNPAPLPTATPNGAPKGRQNDKAKGTNPKPPAAIQGGTPPPVAPPPPPTPLPPSPSPQFPPPPPPPSPEAAAPPPPPPTRSPAPPGRLPPIEPKGKGKFIWWIPAREAVQDKPDWPIYPENGAHKEERKKEGVINHVTKRHIIIKPHESGRDTVPPWMSGYSRDDWNRVNRHHCNQLQTKRVKCSSLARHDVPQSDVVLEDFAHSILDHSSQHTRQSQVAHRRSWERDARRGQDDSEELSASSRSRGFENDDLGEGFSQRLRQSIDEPLESREGLSQGRRRSTEESLRHTIETLRSTQKDLRQLMHRAHHLGQSLGSLDSRTDGVH